MANEMSLATLVTVKNMERAVRFYTKTLGAKIVYRPRGEMRKWWSSIAFGDSEIWLVTPEKWEKRKLAYHALVVKDIGATVAALKKKRVKFGKAVKAMPETKIDGPIAHEEWGSSAFFTDSEGNTLMLWENAPM